jgi:hypothetical protein
MLDLQYKPEPERRWRRPVEAERSGPVQQATVQTRFGAVSGWQTPFGVLALVSPRRLDKDPEYQREFDQEWAQKIARNWDNSLCRPINVRLRDGNLYITNGQHTAEAAHLAGVEEVLVVINNGSPSRQKEAREFVDFQTKVKRMRPYDTYRASLVAGDEDALIVRKVTNELDITVAAAQDQDPFVLTSITAARQIADEFGEDGLRDTLEVAMVWADHNRFRSDLLKGIADALDSKDKEIVLGNARKWGTSDALYRKANDAAGGRGYRTISNIAHELSSSRRRTGPRRVVHES